MPELLPFLRALSFSRRAARWAVESDEGDFEELAELRPALSVSSSSWASSSSMRCFWAPSTPANSSSTSRTPARIRRASSRLWGSGIEGAVSGIGREKQARREGRRRAGGYSGPEGSGAPIGLSASRSAVNGYLTFGGRRLDLRQPGGFEPVGRLVADGIEAPSGVYLRFVRAPSDSEARVYTMFLSLDDGQMFEVRWEPLTLD